MSVVSLKKRDISVSSGVVKISKHAKKTGLLLVHASWCGHCVRFMPEYKKLAREISSHFPLLEIESKEIPQQMLETLKIRGFPSLFFFDQTGKIIAEYDGADRTLPTIKQHICKVYHHCKK